MKRLFTIAFLTVTLQCVAQSIRLDDEKLSQSGAQALMLIDTVSKVRALAERDISNGTPFLLLQGGIAPVIYGTDQQFKKKFRCYYFEWGCTGPDEKIAIEYNRIIFDHLTVRYNLKWTKSIRTDVIGFGSWLRKRG